MSHSPSIIIVTWNGLEATKRCLASLEANTSIAHRVIVVDNGSEDGTCEWIRQRLSPSDTIFFETNTGYRHAVNAGIALASQDADVVLLNNDVTITSSDWLERLRDAAYSSVEVGLVGCRLIDGERRLNHAGGYVVPESMQGELIAGRELDVGQFTRKRVVEYCTAAVLYVKRDVLATIGSLDDHYFSYYEDTDFAFMAARSGFTSLFLGELTLRHEHNLSSKVNRAPLSAMIAESQGVFAARWRGRLNREFRTGLTIRCCTSDMLIRRALEDVVFVLHESRVAAGYSGPETIGPRWPLVDAARERPRGGDVTVCVGPESTLDDHRFDAAPSIAFVLGECVDSGDVLSGFDQIWTPWHTTAEALEQLGRCPDVRYVPWAVDGDYFHSRVPKLRKTSDTMYLAVFDAEDETAAVELVDTFDAAFDRSEAAFLLCLLSGPAYSDFRDRLIRRVAELGGGRIVLGSHEYIPNYQWPAVYKACDVFISMPSQQWHPQRAMESMAVGVPIIAPDADTLAEIVDDDAFLYAESWDTEVEWPSMRGALVDALYQSFDVRSEFDERGAAAARRMSKRTWRGNIDRIIALVEEVRNE